DPARPLHLPPARAFPARRHHRAGGAGVADAVAPLHRAGARPRAVLPRVHRADGAAAAGLLRHHPADRHLPGRAVRVRAAVLRPGVGGDARRRHLAVAPGAAGDRAGAALRRRLLRAEPPDRAGDASRLPRLAVRDPQPARRHPGAGGRVLLGRRRPHRLCAAARPRRVLARHPDPRRARTGGAGHHPGRIGAHHAHARRAARHAGERPTPADRARPAAAGRPARHAAFDAPFGAELQREQRGPGPHGPRGGEPLPQRPGAEPGRAAATRPGGAHPGPRPPALPGRGAWPPRRAAQRARLRAGRHGHGADRPVPALRRRVAPVRRHRGGDRPPRDWADGGQPRGAAERPDPADLGECRATRPPRRLGAGRHAGAAAARPATGRLV
ncbi:MAG: Lipopolysaccharide export system permease protein LptF, partial [uncultured Acetobacteraceae bacterium]